MMTSHAKCKREKKKKKKRLVIQENTTIHAMQSKMNYLQ